MYTKGEGTRPCGLKASTCDSICSMDEWLHCADSHGKDIPQRVHDKIKQQRRLGNESNNL